METTEIEKSNGSEDTNQLNRNRSFKSKQLVRSQAIRETHSPPRALSPAQLNPTVTISNNNNISAPTASNGDISSPNVPIPKSNEAISPSTVANSVATVEQVNDERTVNVNASEDSSHVSVRCSDVVNSSDVKNSDNEDFKKKLPVEIQITSGGWDDSHLERTRARRWHSDAPRDLLSNNPRVCCVCGTCTACVHCRGRRRRHYCPTKQDSGIVCSDDCGDCSDNETGATNNNDHIRKASSLDVDDQAYICRCPERKDRPKNIMLSRNDSDDRNEPTGPELVAFIKDTLNKNVKDRMALLKIEKELHALVNDTGRCIVKFPVMTSYGRMLVHRCAALFQLSHHVDQTSKNSVLVTKSGTSGGRIPCTSFKEWCTVTFPPSPQRLPPEVPHAKSILKRDTNSLDEPGTGALSSNRSKSLEQREREYERVRRRIFSSQDEAQWPWLATGPIKVLTTPEGGRNKLLKVQSLEGSSPGSNSSVSWRGARGSVSKSHSFGGYEPTHTPRLLSRQGDLASSSWRLSPSSSGYKTLSLRSTDSITPSPTGGGSPEPSLSVAASVGACADSGPVVWAVTDMSAVPTGACVIHPQTGRPLTNPDGSIYHFDPANPPVLYDPTDNQNEQQKYDSNGEKRRGRLEKQHSFIDNDCECQPSEVCRNKCCCECRRHDGCTQKTTAEKETITKPASPSYETSTQTNAQEQTNQQQFEQTTNQKAPTYEPANQKPETYEPTNQRPTYETPPNQKTYDTQRSFETTNQSVVNNGRPMKLTNEVQEVQYQQYVQGYRTDDVTSPPQMMNHYVQQDMSMQVMSQAKVAPIMPDHNLRPISLTNITSMTNMVYPTAPAQGYPYQYRVDPSLQMYQPMMQQEEPKVPPSPHPNETAFRIDPSYPYAAVDYTAATCGACVDTNNIQAQQRSYSMPYAQVDVPQPVMPPYPVNNVILPQPHIQPYPYQEQIPWSMGSPAVGNMSGVGVGGHKIVIPELYPIMQYPQPAYPHYNIVYPQVIPQPYPICQPMYPVMEKPQDHRRNSFSNRQSNRNSISGSARTTPHQDDKVPYDEKARQNEIQAKIQQIKSQMAQLNTRDNNRDNRDVPRDNRDIPRDNRDVPRDNRDVPRDNRDVPRDNRDVPRDNRDKDKKRDEWRRRNSGNGLLGNCPAPVNSFNGRVNVGRVASEDGHLSSAARAIVNSIRNMQARNTYQDNRRDYRQDRPDFRRRDRDDNTTERDPRPNSGHAGQHTERFDRNRGVNMPVYRHPYIFRQMSPGTWCRRSPGPVHPVLNHPRRPHPDNRNQRR